MKRKAQELSKMTRIVLLIETLIKIVLFSINSVGLHMTELSALMSLFAETQRKPMSIQVSRGEYESIVLIFNEFKCKKDLPEALLNHIYSLFTYLRWNGGVLYKICIHV